ncbi:imidazolonepropionase [Curtobacterium ammoniigenes]|uniref:imidazolonepropionase n=1 Tax=Curtobacterium ammoniigenes TaxID=395387 RepID=UPI0009F9CD95|nr:imidazolonepropionase [Curtobacterium ammoniigenes]
MTTELITDIGELRPIGDPHSPRERATHAWSKPQRGSDGADAAIALHDQAILVEDGIVAWIGSAQRAPAADRRTSVGGRTCLPGWVDSHTHLVFAGDRSREFVERMAGRPYAAGGIMTTVAETRATSDDELRRSAIRRIAEATAQGTTTIEAKTGYGLDLQTELRLARIAAATADTVTFLGAHIAPPDVDRRSYIDLVSGPMLDAVRPFVQAIDVFCEQGAFTVHESSEVLRAGRAAGLELHVHGNQLGPSGGVRLAVELDAASVDHCNYLEDSDIDALAGGTTVATLLPVCDLSTRAPLAPARRLVDAGVRIALATNCNPGTSFSTSMQAQIATAVLQQELTLEEALAAATVGGAAALRSAAGPNLGRIVVGAPADLQILDAPSATHVAYRPGVPLTVATWRRGVRARRAEPIA